MEKNIESEKIGFFNFLKNVLRAEGIGEDFNRVCEKAVYIIDAEKQKDI